MDRIWVIWGSYYNIPKAISYLLKGAYKPSSQLMREQGQTIGFERHFWDGKGTAELTPKAHVRVAQDSDITIRTPRASGEYVGTRQG